MSAVRQVLREAQDLVKRAHWAPPEGVAWISIDDHYQRARPLQATRWTTVGALCRVAPARSAHDPEMWADNTNAGWEAFRLLEEAAEQQGYASVLDVDRAGLPAVLRLFARALQLAPVSRRATA